MFKFVPIEEQTFTFDSYRYCHVKVGGKFGHIRDVKIFTRVCMTLEYFTPSTIGNINSFPSTLLVVRPLGENKVNNFLKYNNFIIFFI